MARASTPGTYQDGVLVRPLKQANSSEPVIDSSPKPRCPRCRTYLTYRAKGKHGAFWGCGNFPHCKFTASTEVVDEAIRRQLNSGK